MSPGGSVEGGLEELVEFRLSLASRSAMRRSIASRTTRMTACAAAGTVLQSSSGMGGVRVITLKLCRHRQLTIPDCGRLQTRHDLGGPVVILERPRKLAQVAKGVAAIAQAYGKLALQLDAALLLHKPGQDDDGPVMIRECFAKLAELAKDIATVRQVHGKRIGRIRAPPLLLT